MSLICAKNLEIKQGSKVIVKEFNWEVKKGENWVLFGLNGCGKTTLLSYLAGYFLANEGEISLFGETVTAENQVKLRRKVGWVSSSFFNRYLKWETVLEIVLAGKYGMLGIQEWVEDKEVQKAKKLLNMFGLREKIRYPYDTLSKGQQEKVLIARALMADVEIMILDEPCSGMDLLAREQFLHLIQEIAEKKEIATVYVTHHTEEILPFFNKAALMKDGNLYSKGDLKEVFQKENLDLFFGVETDVVWTKKHFFINLNIPYVHEKELTFI